MVDNIKDPKRLVVIDFEYSEDHKCQRQYQIALYDFPPDRGDFNCDEIYKAAEFTEVWTPREYIPPPFTGPLLLTPPIGTIQLFGGFVPIEEIKSVHDLVDFAPSQEGLFEPEQILRSAEDAIFEFRRTYEDRRPYVTREKYQALSIAM